MPDSIDVTAILGTLPTEEPGVDRPTAQVAWQLRWQAAACARMGSPLYGLLLARGADDVEAGGPCWRVLRGQVGPGRGDALALRFMAAAHRLVLTGAAPSLARHYPSVGGDPGMDRVWADFRAVVEEQADTLAEEVASPCQTNEVGRAAGLAFGFLEVAAGRRPLRLLELGAAAGLHLRWDHFRYGGGGATWGPVDSPVDLTGHWAEAPAHARAETAVTVAERRGCDLRPVDPTTPEGRLLLRSSVWADQVGRLARLEGALEVARAVPASIEAASADEWLAETLRLQAGAATVVYQSVMDEYLPDGVRERQRAVIAAAGSGATADAPVHWLRLEPATRLRAHAISMASWPGGTDRVIAICRSHGTEARRPQRD